MAETEGAAASESGLSPALEWLHKGSDSFVPTCSMCKQDIMEVPFPMTAGKKITHLGTEGMLHRKLRCAKCGEDVGARNNARLQEQRPRPRSPDRCCHRDDSGQQCNKTLVRGDDGNVSKSQWLRKSRGDRRCNDCAQKHAECVNGEIGRLEKRRGCPYG